MENDWLKQRRILSNVPHPGSPAGKHFDWSRLGVPHPNSPAGRNFDYLSSIGIPHPDSPVGRSSDSQLLGTGNALGPIDELENIKAAISKFIRGNKATCSGAALTSLFMGAVPVMDLSTDPNQGILYSGKQGDFFTFRMSLLAEIYAKKYNKKLLAWTTDGKWLNSWEPLSALVGANNANQIWLAASIRYVNFLKGDVVVFLANQAFGSIFRQGGTGEQRALYNNPKVERILYVIEHSAPDFDRPKAAKDGRAWFFPSVKHLEEFTTSNP